MIDVASAGPPLVITSTNSNTLKESITVYTTTIEITVIIIGMIILVKIWNWFAPSSNADSNGSTASTVED